MQKLYLAINTDAKHEISYSLGYNNHSLLQLEINQSDNTPTSKF